MKITVVLEFTPRIQSDNLLTHVDLHREVETWANNIKLQYIGAQFNVEVLECYSGDNPFIEDQERFKF